MTINMLYGFLGLIAIAGFINITPFLLEMYMNWRDKGVCCRCGKAIAPEELVTPPMESPFWGNYHGDCWTKFVRKRQR